MASSAGSVLLRLGEFCDLRYGKIVKKSELDALGYPVWSGYGIVGYHSEYMFEQPQVSITCRGVGGTGNVHMTPPRSWVTNLAITIVPRNPEQCDTNYLFWAMKASDRRHLITGSAQHQITIEHLKRHEVPIPPIKTQRSIAEVLGALDDKIELNRRRNQTLEAMARAIFKSWFVDFDPVKAKAAIRREHPDWTNEQVSRTACPTMPDSVAAHFPDTFDVSDIGAIPTGWSETCLAAEVTASKGLSYKGQHLCEAGFGLPMHNLNSVLEGGGYKHAGIKWYDGVFKPQHLLAPGDVIVTNTEQGFEHLLIGFPAIVPKRFGARGIFSHHTYKLSRKSQSYLPEWFTYLLLRTPVFHDLVAGHSNGTTVNMLPIDGLQKPRFVRPPRPLVEQYGRLFVPLQDRIEVSQEEIGTLGEIRDTLLPKLISGELRIPDAERLVERTS
ncbi:Type I restriction modification DNA specificity domain protein [Caulifigura coniformis]|uniref:Type I restriction modification DNA specificity domain protein n=1 Tax=Caulifigura coniformis TaxID=2527983 RepID=A0A517SIK2_9PLAN|nr:restriction endonuclease subunit S [Caulifigura coniformis]QDT55951.1 Type I restriction modification DNA specificity domain protein [Caulifigura coniformis]